MRFRWKLLLSLLALAWLCAGCGHFLARRLAQAPNTYPDWIKRTLPMQLDLGTNVLSGFPERWLKVGPPAARLRYRVVPPRDYRLSFSSTHWQAKGETWFKFKFRPDLPGLITPHTHAPRGTVVLLHGYSLDQRRMAPWAFRLAQEGWRCVLVDLRGHGQSTGQRIYFGLVEIRDLSQLLDELNRTGELIEPVAAFGESFGGALALRWKAAERRVRSAVAIAPYAELSRAVLNMRQHNAAFVPTIFVKAALKRLPEVLQANAAELDPATVLQRSPVAAFFVAGAADRIAPPDEVRRLQTLATPASPLLIVPDAPHESVPYFFDHLAAPVIAWLNQTATLPAGSEPTDFLQP